MCMNYLRVALRNIHIFYQDIYELQLVFERIQLCLEPFYDLALAVYFSLPLGLKPFALFRFKHSTDLSIIP